MKKNIAIIILNLVLFSCTTEHELIYQENSTTHPKPTKRSLSEALEIAQDATSLFNTQARSQELRTIDMKNIQYLCMDRKSRSQSGDTLLYVINYADNNGFAVVSANPNTAGLIAVTEKGNYNPTSEEMNNNTGMGLFMDMAEMYVSNPDNDLQNTGPLPILEIMERVDTTDTYILPKLITKWGQTWHEGRYCPNGISGCVVTALAQIMTYFEHPTQMNITYEGAPINMLNLDWEEIKKYKNIQDDKANEQAHEAIGYLCRQLSELTNSSFEPGGTYATFESALLCMNRLGYIVPLNVMNYNSNVSFRLALENNSLIFMGGFTSAGSGHAWVVDGHLKRELHYTAYTREINSELWQLHDERIINYCYNHINWGDNGLYNGYFLENAFHKSSALMYDDMHNNSGSNYTTGLKYFIISK